MANDATITHFESTERQRSRGYAPLVVTEGGRTIWLGGHQAAVAADGTSILYDIDAQTRRIFELLEITLQRAGATLAHLVTMTVFIVDPSYGDRFCAIRRELLGEGPFPASALITAGAFRQPGVLVEIQGVAVI
jgi:enamine deaminase RidA (YjgF/YER057c/UK114 family)